MRLSQATAPNAIPPTTIAKGWRKPVSEPNALPAFLLLLVIIITLRDLMNPQVRHQLVLLLFPPCIR